MKHQATEIPPQLCLVMASWKAAVWEGWNTSQILDQSMLSNFWMFISISESCVTVFAKRGIWSFNNSLCCTFLTYMWKGILKNCISLDHMFRSIHSFLPKPTPCPHSHFSCLGIEIFYEAHIFLSIFRSLRGYPEYTENPFYLLQLSRFLQTTQLCILNFLMLFEWKTRQLYS